MPPLHLSKLLSNSTYSILESEHVLCFTAERYVGAIQTQHVECTHVIECYRPFTKRIKWTCVAGSMTTRNMYAQLAGNFRGQQTHAYYTLVHVCSSVIDM